MKITVIKKRYTIINFLVGGIGGIITVYFWLYVIKTEKLSGICSDILYIVIAIFILLFVKYLWDMFFGIYSYTFVINQEGVIFTARKHKHYIKWDDVDSIMIYPNPSGIMNKSSMICFIKGKEYPLRYRNAKQFNENFLGVQFREKIILEIRKYWDKPIQGIYHITGRNM